jgi:hypothetical protein
VCYVSFLNHASLLLWRVKGFEYVPAVGVLTMREGIERDLFWHPDGLCEQGGSGGFRGPQGLNTKKYRVPPGSCFNRVSRYTFPISFLAIVKSRCREKQGLSCIEKLALVLFELLEQGWMKAMEFTNTPR